MIQQNNTPALRFPPFTEGWVEKKLGEVAEISSGGTPSRTNKNYWNGNIPWITTTLIDFNTIEKAEELITEEGLKNSSAKLFPTGTLLMAMYGQGKTRGKIAILGIEASTNQACGAIITNSDILNSLFLFQNLSKRYDEIRDLSNQGGQENLSGGIIKSIEISFPTLPEQQKIATFFTAIDKKLSGLKQKRTLLEQYKKGVMQQLFSQALRFKNTEGGDFEEWELKKLGEIASKKSSNIAANKIENNFGDFIIYGASGILKKVNFYEEENDYISIVKDGAGVGRLFYCKGKSSVLGTMEIIKPKTELNTYFLLCLLENIDFTKYITGSTIPHIYFKDYSVEICKIPCLAEQMQIAHYLSTIDAKIQGVTAQIDKMEKWKKGLLQQIFV
jgi:type I restriction enzyme, S subunit